MAINRGGRPPHEPTEETRRVVEVMAACGDTYSDIALALGIVENTLKKHYRAELVEGKARANSAVKAAAYKMAVSGQCPAMTIFWLKTQCRWREPQEIDVTSGGRPLGELSADELERKALEILARRAGGAPALDGPE